MSNKLHENIRKRRESLGITQQELANRMGVSVPRISELENGKSENPRLTTLEALAKALELPLPTLVQV